MTGLGMFGLVRSMGPQACKFSAVNIWRVFHPPRSAPPPATQWPGDSAEQFSVESPRDRVRLFGWFLPSSGPHAVVICHGLGETAVNMAAQAELLRSNGLHVAVFDLRGHGRSSGHSAVTNLGSRYVADLAAIIDHVAADARVSGRIGLLAFSFSTWTAVQLCVTDKSQTIGALVCDSGPEQTTGRALGNIIGAKSVLEPERISAHRAGIAALSRELAQRMIGQDDWPPSRLDVPTLFLAGKRDRVVDAREVQSLADRYPNAEIHVHPRAAHVKFCHVDSQAYSDHVVGHFNEHLALSRAERK